MAGDYKQLLIIKVVLHPFRMCIISKEQKLTLLLWKLYVFSGDKKYSPG